MTKLLVVSTVGCVLVGLAFPDVDDSLADVAEASSVELECKSADVEGNTVFKKSASHVY